jgi:thymidylate synthase ThyX
MDYLTLEDRGFRVTVVADSINEWGNRLTTEIWRYPRFIHADIMTHRDFSRNASSSRAIPVKKLIEQVRNDPAMPIYWGKNQSGMQAAEELTGIVRDGVISQWLQARDKAVFSAEGLMVTGLHKQLANRILEPWMWMTTIVSSTNWGNFYHLRRETDANRNPFAQPELKLLADLSFEAKKKSQPEFLKEGEWHLPFVKNNSFTQSNGYDLLLKLSVARCARVSYLNHDGTVPSIEKDVELHDKLIRAPHASPFEHQATPRSGRHANFTGFLQYRKLIPGEYRG